jgi:tetratricopeptide (TPR) repeat protein
VYDDAMIGRVAFLALAMSVPASAALAQNAGTDAPSASYTARVRAGMNATAHGDVAAGMRNLRDAIAENPSLPQAYCYVGEAERARQDSTGALDAFQTCLRFARELGEQHFVAISLHGIASTLELLPERLQDARTAWLEYIRFADQASSHADARIGRARIEAIDAWVTLETQTADVRARIAAREAAR